MAERKAADFPKSRPRERKVPSECVREKKRTMIVS